MRAFSISELDISKNLTLPLLKARKNKLHFCLEWYSQKLLEIRQDTILIFFTKFPDFSRVIAVKPNFIYSKNLPLIKRFRRNKKIERVT